MKRENTEQQKCANCSHLLNKSHQSIRRGGRGHRKKEEEAIVQDIKIIDPHGSASTISVHEALSSLYNLQLLNELPSSLLQDDDDDDDDDDEEENDCQNEKGLVNFVLCQNCSPLLVQFYNLSVEFHNLGRADSYLWKCVDKLNRIMSMVQATWTEMLVQEGEEQDEEQQQQQKVVSKNEKKCNKKQNVCPVNRNESSSSDKIMLKKYYTNSSLLSGDHVKSSKTDENCELTEEEEESMADEENNVPIRSSTQQQQPQHIDLVPLVQVNGLSAEEILTSAFVQAENLISALRTARMKNNEEEEQVEEENVDPLYIDEEDDDEGSPPSLIDQNFDDDGDDDSNVITDTHMEIDENNVVDIETSGDENAPSDDEVDLDENSVSSVPHLTSDQNKVDIDKKYVKCDPDNEWNGYSMRPKRRSAKLEVTEQNIEDYDDGITQNSDVIDDEASRTYDNSTDGDDEYQVDQDYDDDDDNDVDFEVNTNTAKASKSADGSDSEFFECDKCQRQFRQARYLRTHKLKACGSGKYNMTRPRSKRKETWGTGVKRESFSLLHSAANNENKKPTANLPYNCTLCDGEGERFNRKTELSRHWVRTHTPHDWDNIKIDNFEAIDFDVTCPVCTHHQNKTSSSITTTTENMGETSAAAPSSFTNLKLLQAHLFEHVTEIYKTCPKCKKVVSRVFELASHLKTCMPRDQTVDSDDPRPFKCPKCPKTFQTPLYLVRHTSQTHLEKTIPCPNCDKMFSRKGDLGAHLKKCVKCGKDGRYQCPQCPSKYSTHTAFQGHLNYHNGVTISCPSCPKTFYQQREYKLHLNEHERINAGLPPKRHVCQECGNSYALKKQLNEHMWKHTGVKKYLCPTCGGRYGCKSVFRIHLLTHSTEKKYKCPTCSKCFRRPDVLKAHMKSHLGKSNLCDECGAGFSLPWTLKLHKRHKHPTDGNSPLECQVCGLTFEQKSSYVTHMSVKHNGERYPCDICDKTFASKEYVIRHRMLHSKARGERKRFKCPICDAGFTTKQNLERHVKTKHPQGKVKVKAKRPKGKVEVKTKHPKGKVEVEEETD